MRGEGVDLGGEGFTAVARRGEALLAYPSCENIRDDVEAMEGVEREMIDALATTHERGCAWRETACSTSARMFPANEPTTTRTDFARRVAAIARGWESADVRDDVV